MAETKKFNTGAILSVAGGKLMCDIGEIYEILNWMTNDNLFTHQLPRAGRECAPHLIKQFPWLVEFIDTHNNEISPENVLTILEICEKKYGKSFDVERIQSSDHKIINPIDELIMMRGMVE